jgi:hypothetical protein
MAVTRGRVWEIVQRLADRTDVVERWQQSVMAILRLDDEAASAGVDAEASHAVLDEETEQLKAELAVAEVDLSRDLALFVEIAENLD